MLHLPSVGGRAAAGSTSFTRERTSALGAAASLRRLHSLPAGSLVPRIAHTRAASCSMDMSPSMPPNAARTNIDAARLRHKSPPSPGPAEPDLPSFGAAIGASNGASFAAPERVAVAKSANVGGGALPVPPSPAALGRLGSSRQRHAASCRVAAMTMPTLWRRGLDTRACVRFRVSTRHTRRGPT